MKIKIVHFQDPSDTVSGLSAWPLRDLIAPAQVMVVVNGVAVFQERCWAQIIDDGIQFNVDQVPPPTTPVT